MAWSVVSCVVLAVCLNEFTAPIYRSRVSIEIAREQARSPLTGAVTETPTTQSELQAIFTAAELVTTRSLMGAAIRDLEARGIVIGPRRRSLPWLPGSASRAQPGSGPALDMGNKIDWLILRVGVEPIRDTRIIRVSVEYTNPKDAATIAGTIAENFVVYAQSQRSDADTSLAGHLRQQAAAIQVTIDRLKRQQESGSGQNSISLTAKTQQLEGLIRELSDSYSKAKTERLSITSQLAQIRIVMQDPNLNPSEIPIHTTPIDALERDLLLANAELARARETFGPEHPKLATLQSGNEAIRSNLKREVDHAILDLENQKAILQGREDRLHSAIQQTENELRTLNVQNLAFAQFDDELRLNRELHNILMARAHEVEITGDMKAQVYRITEAAVPESTPIRPRKTLNLAIGLILGVISGFGVALLLESWRRTIRTPDDVGRALQLPVLGLIPKDSNR